jgi:hypothetical protein
MLFVVVVGVRSFVLPRRFPGDRQKQATQRWFASLSLIHTHTQSHISSQAHMLQLQVRIWSTPCCRSGSPIIILTSVGPRPWSRSARCHGGNVERDARRNAFAMGSMPSNKGGVAMPVTFFLGYYSTVPMMDPSRPVPVENVYSNARSGLRRHSAPHPGQQKRSRCSRI